MEFGMKSGQMHPCTSDNRYISNYEHSNNARDRVYINLTVHIYRSGTSNKFFARQNKMTLVIDCVCMCMM